MHIDPCPTIRPTLQQFNNFYQFIHHLDNTYKHLFGMVKIIPPKGWRPMKNYQSKLQNLQVKNAIEQNIHGSGGYYESRNILQKGMNFKAYKKYAEGQSSIVRDKSIQEKEQFFWKTLTYSSPIYGADLTATLMGDDPHSWNMTTLDSLLKHAIPHPLKGVTQPYCYIGTWKASFSWHKEDLDLAAINYIHEGAPKIWYSIAASDGPILQQAAKDHYRQQYLSCKQFLRHKTFLINPQILIKKYPLLKISRGIHQQGEMIIVFGGAYHQGFNCGFNIAQAVNYATIDWLEQLLTAQSCQCSKKSIKGEVESILYNLEQSPLFDELIETRQFMNLREHVARLQEEEKLRQVSKEESKDKNLNKSSKRNKTKVTHSKMKAVIHKTKFIHKVFKKQNKSLRFQRSKFLTSNMIQNN